MKPSASDLNSISALNAVTLEEELTKIIDQAIIAQEMGICSRVTGFITQQKLYEQVPEKAKAILCRLEALSMMITNDDLENWLVNDGTNVMPAASRRALISAAAEHPLSVIEGKVVFEKESFLRRVLGLAEPAGSVSN